MAWMRKTRSERWSGHFQSKILFEETSFSFPPWIDFKLKTGEQLQGGDKHCALNRLSSLKKCNITIFLQYKFNEHFSEEINEIKPKILCLFLLFVFSNYSVLLLMFCTGSRCTAWWLDFTKCSPDTSITHVGLGYFVFQTQIHYSIQAFLVVIKERKQNSQACCPFSP